MEIFHLENKKYIVTCPECSEILKFEINTNDMSVSGECKNGHYIKDKSIEYFKNNCIQSSDQYNNKCYQCHEFINSNLNNFICLRCQKLFCDKCLILHNRKEKHNIRNYYINSDRLCAKHNRKYLWFCEICKMNLCEQCNKFNNCNHSTKSFIDIIPSQNEKDIIAKNISRFKEHLEDIKYLKTFILEDINKRSYQLNKYIEFLEEISDKLFENYNCYFFDYYNFENIKYLSKLINNEDLYDTNKYIDYLLFGENLNFEENNKIIKKKETNNNDFMFNNLEYYKDNLFISYQDKSIYLYEFKNFSFQEITKYEANYLGQIHSVKPAKYSNDIFINFKNKKNIKMLEWNELNKSLKLAKEEIYSIKTYPEKNFKNYIDNKNQNIVTLDNLGELTVWKKKLNKYIKCLSLKENFENIFNINDSLFGINKKDVVQFYQSNNYQCIKTINFNCSPNFIGIMENKLFVFNYYLNKKIFLVDAKFLEIIKIIEFKISFQPKIKNDYLLLFYINKDKIFKIQKKSYDAQEGTFRHKEKIQCESNFESIPEILITNNYYTVLFDKNKFSLINI